MGLEPPDHQNGRAVEILEDQSACYARNTRAGMHLLMVLSALIFIEKAPSGTDNWAIYSVLIAQAVTIFIFLGTAYLAKKSDRDKRARDTKRDVLLEVAPAVQRAYASLAELTNPLSRIDDFIGKFTSASGAVAKLTAVANDETLEAARQLLTTLGAIMTRLLIKRVEVGTDLEAMKQLVALWREEIKAVPDLLADFTSKARDEIPLPLDKSAFSAGLKASNDVMSGGLERLFEALARQESGTVREAQTGQLIPDGSHNPPQAANDIGGAQPGPTSQEVLELHQRARFWEYRFLSVFLVHRSQAVLTWLAGRQHNGQPTTTGYYDAELAALVVAPGERVAVLQALEAHALIFVDQGSVIVTSKGFDYLQWRGPLAPVTQ